MTLAGGCKSSQKYDLIEAELRTRNRELAEARAELDHYRGLSHVYQSQLSRSADPRSQPGDVPVVPLKAIELGSGTGGIDLDNHPGDDALQVLLVPKDDDGSAVKVPGRVVVLAFEILPNGVKSPIGRWDVSPEQLRKYWRSGLFSQGYSLAMQWDRYPSTEKLRIAVRFTTLDGRVYEIDQDVTIRRIEHRPAVRIGGVIPQ